MHLWQQTSAGILLILWFCDCKGVCKLCDCRVAACCCLYYIIFNYLCDPGNRIEGAPFIGEISELNLNWTELTMTHIVRDSGRAFLCSLKILHFSHHFCAFSSSKELFGWTIHSTSCRKCSLKKIGEFLQLLIQLFAVPTKAYVQPSKFGRLAIVTVTCNSVLRYWVTEPTVLLLSSFKKFSCGFQQANLFLHL